MPPLDNAGDLLFQLPRPGEPESALIGGMAAPNPLAFVPDTSGPSPPGPQQEPVWWTYDINPASGVARATFNGEVSFTSGGSATAGVTTWNGRTGAVVLTAGDVTAAGGAPLASPVFTGVPAAPTASAGTSTTQIATTAFVGAAIAAQALVASFNGRTGAVTLSVSDVVTAGGAPSASPAFTGVPTGPTAVLGTATGQLATTQFVANAIGAAVVSFNGRTGAVLLTLSDVQSVGGAPVASPTFTGVPAGPTAAPGTSTTQLASTAFVTNAVAAATAGVSSFNTRTGAVTLQAADVTNVGGALLLSPNFTGTPTAPTQTAGDSSTRLATTAFVATAIGAMAPVVASFNARTGTVTLQASDVTGVGGALLASPVFTGTPAAPTPTAGDNSTRIATTAFVAVSYAPLASPAFSGTPTVPTAAVGTNTTQAASTAYVVTQAVAKAGDTMTGVLGVSGGVPVQSTTTAMLGPKGLRFAQGAGDQSGAGTIGYAATELQITGVGTTGTNRLVSIYDNLGIGGNLVSVGTITANGDFTGHSLIPATDNTYVCGFGGRAWSGVASFAFNNMSDINLKTDIGPLPECLPLVESIMPHTFRWREGSNKDDLQWGFVAQDIGAAMTAAGHQFGGLRREGDYLMLDGTQLTAVLWQAVRELTARVQALEAARV